MSIEHCCTNVCAPEERYVRQSAVRGRFSRQAEYALLISTLFKITTVGLNGKPFNTKPVGWDQANG